MLVVRQKPGQELMPVMGKQIQITLDENDLGQILDALRCR
jgi:hypothetical protein